MSKRRIVLVAVFGAALVPPSLRAAPASVVEFSPSEPDCPDPEFIDRRFRQLVGENAQSPGKAKVTLVRTADGSLDFTIRIVNDVDWRERRFVATSCSLGAETAALIIAISLFPERADDVERRAEELRAVPREAATPQRVRETAMPQPPLTDTGSRAAPTPASPPTVSPRAYEVHGTLSLAAGVDVATLPQPGVGFGAGAGLEIDRVRLELTGARFLNQSVELPEGRGVRFALAMLGLHACYAIPSAASVTVSPCLGATGFRLSGEGSGAQQNYTRVDFYGGPALGAALHFRPTDLLALRLYTESFVALDRPRFVLEERFVHRPARIGVVAFVGSELRF
jgi:hypothetical protein